MQITYAGSDLVTGESALDVIGTGVVPSGIQDVVVVQQLRAEWNTPIARGNRMHTIQVKLDLPPEDVPEDALADLLLFFGNLPKTGDLVITDGEYAVTFAGAALATMRPARPRMGVSNSVNLTFEVGAAAQTAGPTINPFTGDTGLLFNGEPLASLELGDGATVLSGLLPDGQIQVQVSKPTRSSWAAPFAYSGRMSTIPVTITPPPAATPELALMAALLFFTNLPSSGALVFQEGDVTVQVPTAILQSFAPASPRRGVSTAYTLTFLATAGDQIDDYLTTEAGDPLITEAGAFLEV